MDTINDWIWNNLLLAAALNLILGVLLVYLAGKPLYKIISHKRTTNKDWVGCFLAITIGVVALLLTGLDNSPIQV
jgi:hypothetical protein